MPPTQATITVTLIAAAAVLAGTGVFVSRLTRRRGLVAAGVVLLVAVGLYLLSVLTWRLHAPAGAGNGG